MGTVLGIKKSVYDQIEGKFQSGFQLPPAGANIEWVITGHKLGDYTDKKTGEQREYLNFICEMTDDDGQEYKHWQFFGLADTESIKELKAFLLGIGRSDWDPENDDLENLNGTRFACDFVHYNSKNKETGETTQRGRFDWKTLVPLNWLDGKPVDGTQDDDAGEEDDEPAPRPKKRGRPKKEAQPEPEDDGDDDGDDDDEDAPRGFKSFSPRRTRRRPSVSDKD